MKKPALSSEQIHIWFFFREELNHYRQILLSILSEDEIDTARSFKDTGQRETFSLTRGILRVLAAGYLEKKAEHLLFSSNPRGKPRLDGLHFNISHSRNLSCLAFCGGSETGVDVEHIRPLPDLAGLSELTLTDDERKNPGNKNRFFNLWTAKESFIKALGTGLSTDMKRIHITLDDNAGVTELRLDGAGVRDWTVHSLACPEGFAGYVCSGLRKPEICYFLIDNIKAYNLE